MDKMIEKTAPTLEARYKALAEGNAELKKELNVAKRYIKIQHNRIAKLERSMISAVTNLRWEG